MGRLGLPLVPSPVRWGLVAAVAVVIFVNSILIVPPAPPPGDPGPFWDKKLHFAAYATLGTALAYATAEFDYVPRTRILIVIGLAMAYGVGIELLQAPLPDRYFSVGDMAANALGALLAIGYLAIEARVPYVRIDAWFSR